MTINSLADLKKNSASNLAKLQEAVSNLDKKKDYGKDRFWKPTPDKAGNAFAIIRFLPTPMGEELPFVRYWDHAFQGPSKKKWYMEKSLTTIGKPDPVAELNSTLWNSGIEANIEQARAQKRRLNYVANIYVIKDSGNPENEGKVFLYRFGKKIFEKIQSTLTPEFEGDVSVDPFDPYNGANFRLKQRKVSNFPNYDNSEFEAPSQLAKTDKEIEAIWKQAHSLAEFSDASSYKSYDELKAKLDEVLETGVATRQEVTPGRRMNEESELASRMAEMDIDPEDNFLADIEKQLAEQGID